MIFISGIAAVIALRFRFLIVCLFGGFLIILIGFPRVHKLYRLIHTIAHHKIAEHGASLHLPDLDTHKANWTALVHIFRLHIVWIRNLGMFPFALVLWVRNTFRAPLTLVLWVVNLRCLPLAILFIIPVVRFARIRIRNRGSLIIPIGGFLVLWVVNLLLVHPVARFRLLWIRDGFRLFKTPIILHIALRLLLAIHTNLIRAILVDNQQVLMRILVVRTLHIASLEQVLAIIVENGLHFLGRVAADVGTKHNRILAIAVKRTLIQRRWQQFRVATATIYLLFVLHRKSKHQLLRVAVVKRLVNFRGKCIEFRILSGTNTTAITCAP
mmetsp:Transcript_15211/g.23074  ORF Transcript_15211/g.23074 Transcript_15211/m.23074 type:complete len:326 (-) Transcript_15211:283-1260(-)